MTVHVVVDDDAVDIRATGLDALWGLRRHLRLSLADVTGARVASRVEARAGVGIRFGGTGFPGAVLAGWLTDKLHRDDVEERPGSGPHLQWWSTYRDDEVLVIDTRLRRPTRVVVQHPDRHDLAWFVGERVGSGGTGA